MMRRMNGVAIAGAILILGPSIGSTLVLAQGAEATGKIYRLERTSTYQHGCFAPCMCPVMQSAPVKGVFRLIPTGSSGQFRMYDVVNVNWRVPLGTTDIRITGSGTYRVAEGSSTPQHQLSLDLEVGEDPLQHFDSGLVAATTAFPRIDIDISIHGGYCWDTVIGVRARPLITVAVSRSSLSWDLMQGATGYDVVRGDLEALRSSGGDFAEGIAACMGNDLSGDSLPYAAAPSPGAGLWFLVREVTGGAAETWDDGDAEQVGSRDPGINSSPAACP